MRYAERISGAVSLVLHEQGVNGCWRLELSAPRRMLMWSKIADTKIHCSCVVTRAWRAQLRDGFDHPLHE